VNEKNARQVFEKHDPYIWKCDSCGKERRYTQEEIDASHKPWPDPQNHDRDYYITCPFCNKGMMEPPTFVSFGGFLEEIFDE
jgi:RNase P subunit RPR2